MREARHGDAGFSALGTPSSRAMRADLVLADAGLEQRMDDAVLGRRGQARAPVADVVGVRAGEDGRIPRRAASATSSS